MANQDNEENKDEGPKMSLSEIEDQIFKQTLESKQKYLSQG